MKTILAILSLLFISLIANANPTKAIHCEVTTILGNNYEKSTYIGMDELLSNGSIKIGTYKGSSIEVIFDGYFNDNNILAIEFKNSKGSVENRVAGVWPGIILIERFQDEYLKVVCRP